jgi:hypothetical protein
MANTIAKAVGYDKNRSKETHRLGSELAYVEAATYRTFARAEVYKNGSGSIYVTRDGKVIHEFSFPEEKDDWAQK